jgi:hypothetical protein
MTVIPQPCSGVSLTDTLSSGQDIISFVAWSATLDCGHTDEELRRGGLLYLKKKQIAGRTIDNDTNRLG